MPGQCSYQHISNIFGVTAFIPLESFRENFQLDKFQSAFEFLENNSGDMGQKDQVAFSGFNAYWQYVVGNKNPAFPRVITVIGKDQGALNTSEKIILTKLQELGAKPIICNSMLDGLPGFWPDFVFTYEGKCYILEYDGLDHFQDLDTLIRTGRTYLRDAILRKYAEKNGYEFLVVTYKEFDRYGAVDNVANVLRCRLQGKPFNVEVKEEGNRKLVGVVSRENVWGGLGDESRSKAVVGGDDFYPSLKLAMQPAETNMRNQSRNKRIGKRKGVPKSLDVFLKGNRDEREQLGVEGGGGTCSGKGVREDGAWAAQRMENEKKVTLNGRNVWGVSGRGLGSGVVIEREIDSSYPSLRQQPALVPVGKGMSETREKGDERERKKRKARAGDEFRNLL